MLRYVTLRYVTSVRHVTLGSELELGRVTALLRIGGRVNRSLFNGNN